MLVQWLVTNQKPVGQGHNELFEIIPDEQAVHVEVLVE